MIPAKYWAAMLVVVLLSAFSTIDRSEPHPYVLRYNTTLYANPKIPEDNQLTVEGVWLGRLLFHDPILSQNGKQGCFSCHQQKYSFTDGRARSIGSKGDTLSVSSMPLINLAWRNQFFWNGRAKTLESLVLEPITHPHELASDTSALIARLQKHPHYPELFSKAFPSSVLSMKLVQRAIAQFCYTIVSPGITLPSNVIEIARDSARLGTALNEESLTGTWIRFSETCGRCHGDGIYGNANMLATNGLVELDDETQGLVIPPLLNLRYTGPFMHDGRFNKLEQVFDHYDRHLQELHNLNERSILYDRPIKNHLIPYDRTAIENFLFSHFFTDTNIVVNSAFGNPFEQHLNPWIHDPLLEN